MSETMVPRLHLGDAVESFVEERVAGRRIGEVDRRSG